jgi:mannose-6-phosphate isomerase-like protein (cupin superfamily)
MHSTMQRKPRRKYVFKTSQTIGYRFPTHSAELVMDRSDAECSEAFLVLLEPGQSPPLHVHEDTEQIFYVLEGEGELHTGQEDSQRDPVRAGDLIRIPPGTHHRVLCHGQDRLVYLSIDCFLGGRPKDEPTWESHLRVVCRQQGWDFKTIRAV